MSTVAAARPWLLRSRTAVARAAERVESLPAPRVLAAFVVVDWLAVLATARVVRHAGWIYYQGGDQLWLYTLGWLLGHGQLTQTPVGYGWPVILAPIARIFGPNLAHAFPAIVLLDVVVLLPVALLSLYGIAARIGGRLAGYWAVVLWIALPFVGILYTNTGYHQRYTELTLPQSFGLTAMSDFPTTVATLVSVYFVVKTLFTEHPQLLDGVAAGVAAGIAIAIKPATSLFLVGPALAFVYKRRWTIAGMMLAGLAPAIVTLTLWKDRGLGRVPLLSSSAPGHVDGLAAAAPLGSLNVGRYWHTLNWNVFLHNLDLLREHFWSGRLIEWLVIGGVIALARRSITAALLIGGWFFSFALVKGSYGHAGIEDASLFRVMMPAFPAFVLLIAALPLLVPHAPKTLRRAWRPAFKGPGTRTRAILIGVAVFLSAVVPLGAFAAVSTHGSLQPVEVQTTIMPVPSNIDIGAAASVHGRLVTLRWKPQGSFGGPVFYRIWRATTDGVSCPPQPGAPLCRLVMPEIATTDRTTFVDRAPAGHWVYRIAVAANWLHSAGYGDAYLVSRPLDVTVP
jgi:hypothetical protein